MDYLKKTRKYSKLKEEAMGCTLWELALEQAVDL
jgi:hypothetical protein